MAVIQTYTPENPVIQMAARQDYGAFFQGEIQMRKAMLYPPFADLCVVGFSGQQEENVEQAARYFHQRADRLTPGGVRKPAYAGYRPGKGGGAQGQRKIPV